MSGDFVRSEQRWGWGIVRYDYKDVTITVPHTPIAFTNIDPFPRNYRIYMVFSDIQTYTQATPATFRGFIVGKRDGEEVFAIEWLDYKGMLSKWSSTGFRLGFRNPPNAENVFTSCAYWHEVSTFPSYEYIYQLLNGLGLFTFPLWLVVNKNPPDEYWGEQYDARYFIAWPVVVRNTEIDSLELQVHDWAPRLYGTTEYSFEGQHYIAILAYHTF